MLLTFLFYSDLFLPTHCRFRELLMCLITLSDTCTLGETPLYNESVRRWDFYVKTQNTHKRQASMPHVEFGLAIPAR
jgi:hypothetical protein